MPSTQTPKGITYGYLQGETGWGDAINQDLQRLSAWSSDQWAIDPVGSVGLTFAYKGGLARDTTGALVLVPDGSLTVPLNASSIYVERTVGGVVSSNTTGWTADRLPMALLSTNATSIILAYDRRVSAQVSADGSFLMNKLVIGTDPGGTQALRVGGGVNFNGQMLSASILTTGDIESQGVVHADLGLDIGLSGAQINPTAAGELSVVGANFVVGNRTGANGSSIATLSLGGTYYDGAGGTNGALKLKILEISGGPVYGLGVSNAMLDSVVPASSGYRWWAGGVVRVQIDGAGVLRTAGAMSVAGGDISQATFAVIGTTSLGNTSYTDPQAGTAADLKLGGPGFSLISRGPARFMGGLESSGGTLRTFDTVLGRWSLVGSTPNQYEGFWLGNDGNMFMGRVGPTAWHLFMYGADVITADSFHNVVIANNLTVGGAITASGDITAFSDLRLKTEIETLTDALDTVRKLRGVRFEMKDRPGQKQIGFIAQETQAVLPEVVRETEFRADPTLAVAYGNVTALLVEAVKELYARVEHVVR